MLPHIMQSIKTLLYTRKCLLYNRKLTRRLMKLVFIEILEVNFTEKGKHCRALTTFGERVKLFFHCGN